MTKTGGTATFTGNVDASAGVLTINGSGGTLALGTGLTHTVNIVTLTAGTLNGGSSTLNVSGSLSATSGTFTAGTGTVNFTSSGAQTIPALTFYNLGFSGAGAKTTATGTITVGGNWDVVGGTARLYTNNSSVTVSGNITGSGNITMGSSGTITVGGSWTNNGAFDAGTGTATVNYNAAGAQTVAALTYNNLTVSGSGIKTLGGNATVTGTLTATGSVLDNAGFSLIVGPKTQWSLNEAYGLNWVEKPQTFDSVTEGFAVIEPTSTADILSWQGFFISVKQNVNVLFLADPGAAAVSSPMSKTLTNDYWYLISSPLDPGGGRDAKTNLSNSPSQLLVGDYNGTAADKWRIYKRLYTNDVYHNYMDGSFETLEPGRGFWLRQKYDAGDKNVYVAGTGVSTTDGYYKMRLNFVALSANTWHQIGNPYWYTIKWSDVKFSDPLVGTEYPLGKIVADLPPDKTETCYVRLALVSSDGKAQDTYNRAGVILTEGGNPDIFSVSELTPPDPCVKLSVTDPSNTGRRALAYDYRSAGQDVYTWNVNLATTYDRTDAALSIKEFFNVPEWMGFTLTDTKTGESFALTGDKTIPVSLTKDTARTFILTAARKEIPTAADAVTPKAFGITGISPNPFNPSTTISFNLAVSGTARVSIYNLSGQLVETLVNGQMTAGSHKAVWNASRYASGVYIVVAESSGLKQSRKITLIK
ncbi:MAG: T9SS type A sorting domain-containing protein [Candidatus Latescibacter sp.]|nr:T9SS type A sorting domain-containing protein [Candidatus Latescibacter sp.]